jgi:hypothetical protein
VVRRLPTHERYPSQPEPDLGVDKRPDRLIERVGVEAICEVKEFRTDAMKRRWQDGGSRIGSFSSDEWLPNVRRAIGNASEQLEPLAEHGRPRVIVLANPYHVLAEIRGTKLIEAMYGEQPFLASRLLSQPRAAANVLNNDGQPPTAGAPWRQSARRGTPG